MDSKLHLSTIGLCVFIAIWFYWSLERGQIFYEYHPYLTDQATGKKLLPTDLGNLTKVLQPTESYINSTTAQERLYDLAHEINFANPFIVEQDYSRESDLRLSGLPVANHSKCAEQLQWILENLESHSDYTNLKGQLGFELTSLIDAFGKPDSGLYSGTLTWLGSYRQCSKVSLNGGAIKTRYCFARMRPQSWPKEERTYPRSGIRQGLCLPETCDTLSFGKHKQQIEKLAKWDMSELYRRELQMDSLFCLPDERSPIRQMQTSGKIYLSAVILWISLVIIASLAREYIHRKNLKSMNMKNNQYSFENESKPATLMSTKTSNTLGLPPRNKFPSMEKSLGSDLSNSAKVSIWFQLLECLSIRNSLKDFKSNSFRVKYKIGERVRVDLGCLDFFKVAMALLVILAHSGLFGMNYTRSLTNKIEMNTTAQSRLLASVVRCVDTFFVFFGVLTTYTLMRKVSDKQLGNPLNWLGANFGIFMRVTPVFMLVYWYSRSVSPYTGSGPWWDYGIDRYTFKGICRDDPWWKSIPYFANIGSPRVPACNLPSWFIVCYMQLSLLMPLITYVIAGLPHFKSKYLVIGFMSILSAASLSIQLYSQKVVREEEVTAYGGFLHNIVEKYSTTGYMSTLGRLAAACIGCLIGYLLRMYELGKIQSWPKWLTSPITITMAIFGHVLIIFIPLIGYYSYLWTGKAAKMEEFAIGNFVLCLAWPIFNAILIIPFTTVFSHQVFSRFCSHSFWHAFNRLGFCMFLVHWEILQFATTNYEQAPSYGFVTDVMKMWSFGIYVSILLAFAIHIIFEAPLARMIQILANRFTPPKEEDRDNLGDEFRIEKVAKIEITSGIEIDFNANSQSSLPPNAR